MRRILLNALAAAATLALVSCVPDRLTVEMFTQIHSDGTCTRRIEYRFERVDSEKGTERADFRADGDLLRKQFRFPSGPLWQMSEHTELGVHVVTLEARLPSPQDADGDFVRVSGPQAPPTRNAISAFVDSEAGVYDYQEVLQDPSSPIAALRMLARGALKRDQEFADAYAAAFATATQGKTVPPRAADLRRLYRQLLAEPLARRVAAVTERPLYGPREQRELARIFEDSDDSQKQLASRISMLTSGVPPEDIDKAVESALQAVADGLGAQLENAGLPFPFELEGEQPSVHFRATLVMPAPIVRANTCFNGDTAVWEFDREELVGRGFEMRVLASTPRP